CALVQRLLQVGVVPRLPAQNSSQSQSEAKPNKDDQDKLNVLRYAIITDCSAELVEVLLTAQMDLHRKSILFDRKLMTPLCYALIVGKTSIVDKLIAAGADIDKAFEEIWDLNKQSFEEKIVDHAWPWLLKRGMKMPPMERWFDKKHFVEEDSFRNAILRKPKLYEAVKQSISQQEESEEYKEFCNDTNQHLAALSQVLSSKESK